ncbi:MAG: GNAT family N-acetyltransferase [Actinomycetota bacterium]
MIVDYRRPTATDVADMAEVAAAAQADPRFHVPYVGADADSIAAEMTGVAGWADTTTVAVVDGRVVGWLLGETDPAMGRVWWWGPFVADESWDGIADELYRRTRPRLPAAIGEEEACGDARSTSIEAWSRRHGLAPAEASVLLRRQRGPAAPDGRVRPLTPADHGAVMALHERAFPATHLTPSALVAAGDPRLVIEVDGVVVGYVAYEIQADGSGYLDYLAVDEGVRGRGLGGTLVEHACHLLFEGGVTHAHLTVREGNGPARSLYRRLGFVEDRLARPYRRGFHIP